MDKTDKELRAEYKRTLFLKLFELDAKMNGLPGFNRSCYYIEPERKEKYKQEYDATMKEFLEDAGQVRP